MNDLNEIKKLALDYGPDAIRRRFHSPVIVALEILGGELQRRGPPAAAAGRTVGPLPGTRRLPEVQPVAANSVFSGTMTHVESASDLNLPVFDAEMFQRRPMSRPRFFELKRDLRRRSPWVTIGRSQECSILINDYTISGRHAGFMTHPANGMHLVQDVGSTNGTTVNQQRLTGGVPYPVSTGDQVSFGRVLFTFVDTADFYQFLTEARAA